MTAKLHPLVQNAGAVISGHIEEIACLFKPGAKISVFVRIPEYPNGVRDFMVTQEPDLEPLIAAIKIRQSADQS